MLTIHVGASKSEVTTGHSLCALITSSALLARGHRICSSACQAAEASARASAQRIARAPKRNEKVIDTADRLRYGPFTVNGDGTNAGRKPGKW